jgi:hypothetical protein
MNIAHFVIKWLLLHYLFTAVSSVPLKCFPSQANAENAVQDLKAEVLFSPLVS